MFYLAKLKGISKNLRKLFKKISNNEKFGTEFSSNILPLLYAVATKIRIQRNIVKDCVVFFIFLSYIITKK